MQLNDVHSSHCQSCAIDWGHMSREEEEGREGVRGEREERRGEEWRGREKRIEIGWCGVPVVTDEAYTRIVS